MVRDVAAEGWRALPGSDVAAVAIRVCRRKGVVVSNVAIGAGYNFSSRLQLMRTCQRPACRAVIEYRCRPRDRVMAGGAVRRSKWCSRRWVRWIVGGLPSRQVALGVPAIRRRNREAVVVVDVARGAGHDFSGRSELVRIRQRKSRCRMIESRSPRSGVVASGA